MSKLLSHWIVIDGYCATRVIHGTDHLDVANRIAFIEKTPRVRVKPWSGDLLTDWHNWESGRKGSGGGNPKEDETYGFYPPSRKWCDDKLRELGYTLPEDLNV